MTDAKTGNVEVLAYAAHPDDAELCCGGLLAKLVGLGYQTGIVDLTRGELSSQGTLEKRASETEKASQALGLSYRENLGLPDGGLSAEEADSAPQLCAVVENLRKLRPELVLIPYWRARHPDHEAASRLLSKAVFFSGVRKFGAKAGLEAYAVPHVLYYQMRVEFKPSFIVDITESVEKKLQAIDCYKSQVQRAPHAEDSGSVKTLISSPLNLAALQARDQRWGAMIGAAFGEPYLMRQAMSVNDPLCHLRNNPTSESLLFGEEL